MVRAKVNEVNASDDALVQKLQKEVQHLRDLLGIHRVKGKQDNVMKELLTLKQENEKLKSGMCEVERLMFENKIMKLEL